MTKHSTAVYMTATLFLLLVAAGILGPVYAQLQQSGGPGSAVTATQAGTWNINNISGTVSLPTGAATAAKQPALGTAGTPSADVITVQGAASMTPLTITGSISNTGFNVTGSLPTGANVIGQVQTIPKTACGTSAFTPAWQAVPTSTTSLTSTTSCVLAIIVTNTNATAQAVTVTDGQGTPVTVINAFSVPANSQVTFPLFGSQMTSGIKWSAGGTGMTGTVVAYQ
ncbi:MAG TPA: hypothetical protein VMT32_06660 [Bryobacteraceae bacterium]|nr:hypothetical protein [Bryobacteraceae bacterium]